MPGRTKSAEEFACQRDNELFALQRSHAPAAQAGDEIDEIIQQNARRYAFFPLPFDPYNGRPCLEHPRFGICMDLWFSFLKLNESTHDLVK